MTFEQLFNIESAIEEAVAAILAPHDVYHEFSDATKRTPGYEVKFAGAPTGQKRRWKDILLDREWRGTLETRIVTTRFQNSDKHAALLVHARIQLSQALLLLNDTNLPFHWVTYIQETSILRSHDKETMQDQSTLHHDLVVSIRDECWLDQ